MNQHPIFSKFTSPRNKISDEYFADFIGSIFQKKFVTMPDSAGKQEVDQSNFPLLPVLQDNQTMLPQYGEDYFEWIDILQSVENAGDTYTMVMLGAGYGRWTIAANLAAKQKNIPIIKTISVEAEPVHAEWVRQAFADNNMSNANHRVIEAGAGAKKGILPFYVTPPEGFGPSGPHDWYGQCFAPENNEIPLPRDGITYQGKDVKFYSDGWGIIEIPILRLEDILTDVGIIDILDMDIQGAEADLIEDSIELITNKVKRMHIGTHSRSIDAKLIEILSKAGWRNVRTYLCASTQETPYGTLPFQDGIQSWINPNFER